LIRKDLSCFLHLLKVVSFSSAQLATLFQQPSIFTEFEQFQILSTRATTLHPGTVANVFPRRMGLIDRHPFLVPPMSTSSDLYKKSNRYPNDIQSRLVPPHKTTTPALQQRLINQQERYFCQLFDDAFSTEELNLRRRYTMLKGEFSQAANPEFTKENVQHYQDVLNHAIYEYYQQAQNCLNNVKVDKRELNKGDQQHQQPTMGKGNNNNNNIDESNYKLNINGDVDFYLKSLLQQYHHQLRNRLTQEPGYRDGLYQLDAILVFDETGDKLSKVTSKGDDFLTRGATLPEISKQSKDLIYGLSHELNYTMVFPKAPSLTASSAHVPSAIHEFAQWQQAEYLLSTQQFTRVGVVNHTLLYPYLEPFQQNHSLLNITTIKNRSTATTTTINKPNQLDSNRSLIKHNQTPNADFGDYDNYQPKPTYNNNFDTTMVNTTTNNAQTRVEVDNAWGDVHLESTTTPTTTTPTTTTPVSTIPSRSNPTSDFFNQLKLSKTIESNDNNDNCGCIHEIHDDYNSNTVTTTTTQLSQATTPTKYYDEKLSTLPIALPVIVGQQFPNDLQNRPVLSASHFRPAQSHFHLLPSALVVWNFTLAPVIGLSAAFACLVIFGLIYEQKLTASPTILLPLLILGILLGIFPFLLCLQRQCEFSVRNNHICGMRKCCGIRASRIHPSPDRIPRKYVEEYFSFLMFGEDHDTSSTPSIARFLGGAFMAWLCIIIYLNWSGLTAVSLNVIFIPAYVLLGLQVAFSWHRVGFLGFVEGIPSLLFLISMGGVKMGVVATKWL
jgi:hypothetical protein